MAKTTSTLLGLALATAVSTSEANAGLFNWFGLTPGYSSPRVTGAYTTNTNQCGPNGCAPCPTGWCGTAVPLTASYGYGTTTPVRFPSTSYPATPASRYPTSTVPVYNGNLYNGNSYTVPCTTGNCPTPSYPSQYQQYSPYQTTPNYGGGLNGNPYYGNY